MPAPVGVYTGTCELHPLVGKNGCVYVEIHTRINLRCFSRCSREAKILGKAFVCWPFDV